MPSRSRRNRDQPAISPVRRRSQKQAGGPWNFGPIPVIGIVGGIGAGKTSFAALLETWGAQVIDADKVGHALLDQKPSREAVVSRFGKEMLDPDDPERVNRTALGARVFSDPASRLVLERILHPRMKATFEKAIARAVRRGEAKAVVLDAAILFEAGWNDICDLVVFVDAPQAARQARVRASRKWTAADLATRESAQWSLDRKRELADLVVANKGEAAELSKGVAAVANRVRQTRGDWFRVRSRAEVEREAAEQSAEPVKRTSSTRKAVRAPADRPNARPPAADAAPRPRQARGAGGGKSRPKPPR